MKNLQTTNNSYYFSLFQQQAYTDALEYYKNSLINDKYPVWDYVLITASNEAQARAYEIQIEHRLKNHQISNKTKYAVIPDLEGKRIGSGGATFSCIKYIAEKEKDFKGKKILVIHSGGDSKRVPQYSACGKLFSPVPRILPNGRRSTLFDEFIIGMSPVAGRIKEGMMVCSGDVLLLFNSLQIEFYNEAAAALSIKENVETGKNHGVFFKDNAGNVGRFLHKLSVKELNEIGAVDDNNNVDIDTGAIIFSAKILKSLYSLIDTEDKYYKFVNDKVRLSFYADFLYPLASKSTLEQFYNEKPEGNFCEELKECRKEIWNILSPHTMKLIQLSAASFVHFGTTKELLKLMTEDIDYYKFLGWSKEVNCNITPYNYSVNNSCISDKAFIGEGSYIEDSRIEADSTIGKKCIVSGITLTGQTVPDDTVLHGLKLNDGRFVCRMYGVDDNPKENKLLDVELIDSLWESKLYPICDTIEEAVSQTLAGVKSGELTSLKESFNNADVTEFLSWQDNINEQIICESIYGSIINNIPAETLKKEYPSVSRHTVKYLLQKAEKLDSYNLNEFSIKIRIYAYLNKLTGNSSYSDLYLDTICDSTLNTAINSVKYDNTYRLKEDVTVNLPVRVNWGGGWSDTPPYCMENGGTVLNAAISLNGSLPIEVTVKKLSKRIIALASTDIGVYKEFDDICELQYCNDPADPFALHKAALIACGVIPAKDTVSIEKICEHLDGGLYINTRVIDIPKGSGLGTSSILAGACIKAIFKALGLLVEDDVIFERVLCMEQLMSTGGGWQDQVGGIVPGVKIIKTKPGLSQKINCEYLSISNETYSKLNKRFAVIYTGQRRLARNLLRDVVGKYICNDPVSLDAHKNIQRLAVLMKYELEKGDIDAFAKLLNEHWIESQRIDAGSTNECINAIFESIEDLIDGKMICGAGGGGFLQIIIKNNISKSDIQKRLNDTFGDSGIALWDCEFV